MQAASAPNNNQIFLSYSSEDHDLAQDLYSFFKEQELNCWMATDNIFASHDYGQAIIEAIQQSKVMIVLFSKEANDSKFVQMEVERAISHKLKIILFRIEDVLPTGNLEFFLSSVQWINAFKGNPRSHFEQLYIDLIRILSIQNNELRRRRNRMFLNPFFNKGRIRRTEYGLTWIIGILLFAGIVSVIFMKTADDRYPLSDLDGFILFFDMILIAWLMISQGTKRAHDISRSGWNQLNPIFFVALPFIEGGTKKNRYGRDPKGRVFVRQKMSIANMLLSFLLPGFILTTIFTPYANDDVAANMKLYEGWKLYQDDDYMFQYPFKWSLDSSKAPSSFIIYTPLDTSEQNSQQVIKIGEDNLIGRGLSLNDYTILSIKDIKKNYKNLVVFSNVEGELNSRACRKVFMEYTEDANIRYALIMYNLVALG